IGGDEVVPRARLPFEYMLNVLRLHEGFRLSDFEASTGLEASEIAAPLARAVAQGWMTEQDGRVIPTELGRRFTNDVVELFLT
ncbi:oxygen-independent coproporphyrinogen III oxidase-like protein, partial [Xanthomonas hortorum pv. carotae]|nr:oxygen-independent coproporphyrinogen III oxidase-like protein [Xanthomonas hortorum pv. carotae]